MRLCPSVPLPATPYRTDRLAERPQLPDLACDGDWPRSEAVRFGFDLLNHGYPWEAHEVWEGPWQAHRQDDPLAAELLQALIQVAAARVLIRDGRESGARRVAERAREHAEHARAAVGRFGLTLASLHEAIEASTKPTARHPLLLPQADGA